MVGTKRGKMVQFSGSYPPEMIEQLERLHKTTRVSIQIYMREALEDLLKKYSEALDTRKGRSGRKGGDSQD